MRSISLSILMLTTVAVCGQDLELELVRTFVGHDYGVNKVVFSPDGSKFASGDTRGGIRVWSLTNESVDNAWNEHYGAILDLQFSSNGEMLLSSGSDGQLMIWDLMAGKLAQRIKSPVEPSGAPNQVWFGKFSADGENVYFGGSNKYVCKKAVGSDDNGKIMHFEKTDVKCGAISPDGSKLTIGVGKVLVSFDLETGEVADEFNTGDCGINSLRYSNDGEKLLCWCSNARVDIRDPETLILRTSFRSGTGSRRFSDLFYTQDQTHIITGDHASRFNVWDLKNRKLVLDQSTEQGTVMAFDMQQDADLLLSGSLDKTIKLWKIVKAKPFEEKKGRNKKEEVDKAELIVIENVTMMRNQDSVLAPLAVVENLDDQELAPEPGVNEVQSTVPDNAKILKETLQEVENSTTESEVTTSKVPVVIEMFEDIPEQVNGRRVIPARKEHRLNLNSRKVQLQVWDDQVVDGDIISLFVNNQVVLPKYSIVEEKRLVEFDATGLDKCFIFLHAHNLGSIPPNTVTMIVGDGEIEHRIKLRSDLKGSASVELNFN